MFGTIIMENTTRKGFDKGTLSTVLGEKGKVYRLSET